MDLTQRLLETIAQSVRDQHVTPETFAAVLDVDVDHACAVLTGDAHLSRDELARACEYLEIDLAAALHVPGDPLWRIAT